MQYSYLFLEHKLLLKAVLVNKQLLLEMKNEIREIRQQNNNSIHIVNAVADFGIEMPIQSMTDFSRFDSSLRNEDTNKKFVGFFYNTYTTIIRYYMKYGLFYF